MPQDLTLQTNTTYGLLSIEWSNKWSNERHLYATHGHSIKATNQEWSIYR